MKELSIEQKAKAYDKALAHAKLLLKTIGNATLGNLVLKHEFEIMFPEHAESEDERIRKALISFLKSPFVNESITDEKVTPWIAWLEKQGEHANFRNKIQIGDKVTRNQDGMLVNLSQLNRVAKKDEKQGEQKPSWSKEDEIALGDALWCCKQAASIAKDENDMGNVWYAETWLKSLKDRVLPQPKQEWSEKDEREVAVLKAYICSREWSDSHIDRALGIVDELVKKLKSLRPQSTWKPSNEQMEYLAKAITTLGDEGDCKTALILNDLRFELKKLKGE